MTKAYPSNLTWEQWELIAGLFPEAKTGGRPRTIAMYAVVNAILYVLCEGCTWRGLPGDFPAWSTVYGYFRAWRKDGTWLKVHDKLYQWVRVAAGREPSPLEAAVDSQSVETATMIHQDVGNNRAERSLRLAVTKRKVSGGSRSMERFAQTADLLSVIQTCRTQGRSVIEFLKQVLMAQGSAEVSKPSLIPQT